MPTLPSWSDFARLRLRQFADPEAIVPLEDWEYMGCLWVGEAIGFTEWLCVEAEPEILRSVALALGALPEAVAAAILERLGLPMLRRGLDADTIEGALGPCIERARFVADRETLEFEVGAPEAYQVSCTVHRDEGLIHVTMMRADYARFVESE
jgi:hypothetical protein